jgi:fagellar hook-basal body proteins
MMRSLFSGVAGLKNHQTKMDVIGNNIANVNTTGFKSGRVTFQDTLNQTLTSASSASGTRGGTNPKQIGLGVGLGSIDTIFTDGSIQSTGKNTDLCISGSGFFAVNDGNNRYYTRNGAFEFDEEGNYVLPGSGLKVQGWIADTAGVLNTTGSPVDIKVPKDTSMAATATTKASYSKNLSADSSGKTISTMTITLADGTSFKVPAGNTSTYGLTDTVSGTVGSINVTLADGSTVPVTAAGGSYKNGGTLTQTVNTMSATLADGTVISVPNTSTVAYKNNTVLSGATVNAMTITMSDGLTVTTNNTTSTIAAKIGSAASGAKISGMTIATANGTITTVPSSTLSCKIGSALSGVTVTAVTSGGTDTLTLSDGSTVTGVTTGSYAVGASYNPVVNSVSGMTLSDGSTVTGTSTAAGTTYTMGGVSSATVSTITGATLSDGSTFTVPSTSTSTYTANSNLKSKVSALTAALSDGSTLTVGANSTTAYTANTSPTSKVSTLGLMIGGSELDVPATDTTTTYAVGQTIASTVSKIEMTLSDGTTTSGISGLTYANGSESYPTVTTTITVYDALGAKHSVPVVLTKTAANTWSASLVPNQSDGVTTKIDGATVTGTLGTLTFDDATGKFKTGTGYSLALTGYTNGASNSTVNLDFSELTQYSGESTAACSDYDGYAAGSLKTVSFDSSGVLTGTFTNNEKRSLAQVAMASFNNPAGLMKSGSSLYSESNNSGKVQIATVNGSGSSVTPSSLEMSNVDLSNEFSDMIITQRGFQSNSKIITVSDEMLETLIGMKR